jgi:hypothetical protein
VLSADNRPREQSKTFFGDFLPLSKKLPAACGGSSALKVSKEKSLDFRFRGNDEHLAESYPPLAA